MSGDAGGRVHAQRKFAQGQPTVVLVDAASQIAASVESGRTSIVSGFFLRIFSAIPPTDSPKF